MPSAPIRESNSPLNMFSATFPTTNLFVQSQPQLIPTRLAAPAASITPTSPHSPSMMKKLSLNPSQKKNDPFVDLLDLSDLKLPTPPPPESPKFDPYA